MGESFKYCQSCGMPLKRDECGGGTNADGTKHPMYCSHCFLGGKFTQPDITVDGVPQDDVAIQPEPEGGRAMGGRAG